MIYLIGLGIRKGDISYRAIELLKNLDKIYLDSYTVYINSYYKDYIKWLENIIDKKIIFADRALVEEQLEEIAKKEDVALLTIGDPLFATTHIYQFKDLIKDIIHAPSVLNYIYNLGLSPYRFGRIISIPHPSKGLYDIESKIEVNLKNDLHTLILLDTDPVLDYKTAIKVYNLDKYCTIAVSIGEKIVYGKEIDAPPPHALIIPAKLMHYEKDFIQC
ncbi:NEQ422 [Nanoarchaeum equitans Kin4-M]|uniref:NEQ422 n=1 Tax=Nanoarchaeum equitans (strain Kin4-M) TaxID=228908 RepID=Q74N26_NANEQ|nr:NEQ422 [Nanoarchaeum equitans Kin4-M]